MNEMRTSFLRPFCTHLIATSTSTGVRTTTLARSYDRAQMAKLRTYKFPAGTIPCSMLFADASTTQPHGRSKCHRWHSNHARSHSSTIFIITIRVYQRQSRARTPDQFTPRPSRPTTQQSLHQTPARKTPLDSQPGLPADTKVWSVFH